MATKYPWGKGNDRFKRDVLGVHRLTRLLVTEECPQCGKDFQTSFQQIERKVFCSKECAAESYSERYQGKKHPGWKGGRFKDPRGYVYIRCEGHPKGIHRGGNYIREHRLVMEKSLGRYLKPHEIVHHKNGIKHDNRIENLELKTNYEDHSGRVTCPYCDRSFRIFESDKNVERWKDWQGTGEVGARK